MTQKNLPDLLNYFHSLEDPRIDRQKLHALPDILLIVFSGSIFGVETWQDFVYFAESKQDLLRKHVQPRRIP
ncbi:transposase family protein [Teredinibacter haidensis]|uniref:transposase family protein n=1 Tax=Teredinibacter haidensis TaxID=2731755 RepID=UPI000948EBA3